MVASTNSQMKNVPPGANGLSAWDSLDSDDKRKASFELMLEALKQYAHAAETFSDGVSGLLFSDLVGDTHIAALAAIRAATGEDA